MQESRSLSKRVYICPTEFLETVVKESRNTTMWDSIIQTRSGGRGGGGIRPNFFSFVKVFLKNQRKNCRHLRENCVFKKCTYLWG